MNSRDKRTKGQKPVLDLSGITLREPPGVSEKPDSETPPYLKRLAVAAFAISADCEQANIEAERAWLSGARAAGWNLLEEQYGTFELEAH